tara:strand:+ start:245 stop:418 length:174 start_codon:yes stop_codon:yes gene_type:complete
MTGSEIRQLRTSHNLRQIDCADIIGVGIRQWQKYEQGYPCKEIYVNILKNALATSTN